MVPRGGRGGVAGSVGGPESGLRWKELRRGWRRVSGRGRGWENDINVGVNPDRERSGNSGVLSWA